MCSASISLRIARARSITRTPNSVGTVPRRPPDQQLHPQLGLELADVLGDVRLHRVQAVGGGREAARLGHGQQCLELAYVHIDLLDVSPGAGPAPPDSAPPSTAGLGTQPWMAIAITDTEYRFHVFDRWSCDRVH